MDPIQIRIQPELALPLDSDKSFSSISSLHIVLSSGLAFHRLIGSLYTRSISGVAVGAVAHGPYSNSYQIPGTFQPDRTSSECKIKHGHGGAEHIAEQINARGAQDQW